MLAGVSHDLRCDSRASGERGMETGRRIYWPEFDEFGGISCRQWANLTRRIDTNFQHNEIMNNVPHVEIIPSPLEYSQTRSNPSRHILRVLRVQTHVSDEPGRLSATLIRLLRDMAEKHPARVSKAPPQLQRQHPFPQFLH